MVKINCELWSYSGMKINSHVGFVVRMTGRNERGREGEVWCCRESCSKITLHNTDRGRGREARENEREERGGDRIR